MECPKCQGDLEEKTFTTIRYHRCDQCGGVMMTPDMVRRAKQTIRSYEIIDVGSARRGRKFNRVEEIDCPFHEPPVRMNKIRDAEQTHIWLEQCPTCERLFFDAGEFTDKHRETMWDNVLELISMPRPS
jgi:Zn-finger nucleic acid-binding protein